MTEDGFPLLPPLFMRHAVEACVVGAVISDMRLDDQPIVYVNPAFERLSGYSAAEILGLNCRFLQGPDQHQPAVDDLRQALIDGRSITVTLRNYRKDGTLFQNELTLSPIHDPAGVVTHYVGFQNDVTAREEEYLRKERRLQISEQSSRRIAGELQRTLDLSLDLITSIDPDGQFVTVNAACMRLLGHARRTHRPLLPGLYSSRGSSQDLDRGRLPHPCPHRPQRG